jgi:hypothetical protein
VTPLVLGLIPLNAENVGRVVAHCQTASNHDPISPVTLDGGKGRLNRWGT